MHHVLLVPDLDGSAGLSYVNLTVLTGNAVDASDPQVIHCMHLLRPTKNNSHGTRINVVK
jgi:hypothetical protein